MKKKEQKEIKVITFPLANTDANTLSELIERSKASNSLSLFFIEGKGLFAIVGGKVYAVQLKEVK